MQQDSDNCRVNGNVLGKITLLTGTKWYSTMVIEGHFWVRVSLLQLSFTLPFQIYLSTIITRWICEPASRKPRQARAFVAKTSLPQPQRIRVSEVWVGPHLWVKIGIGKAIEGFNQACSPVMIGSGLITTTPNFLMLHLCRIFIAAWLCTLTANFSFGSTTIFFHIAFNMGGNLSSSYFVVRMGSVLIEALHLQFSFVWRSRKVFGWQ